MAEKAPGYFKVTSKGQSGWQWELISEILGQTIAMSPYMPERDDALKTLKWLRTNVEKCPIVGADGKPVA